MELVEACEGLDLLVPLVALNASPKAVQGKMVDDPEAEQISSR